MSRATDVWYRVKNIWTSPAHLGFVAIAAALGMMQSGEGWAGILYRYYGGIPYLFEDDLDLARLMTWALPHFLLSLSIGRQAEDGMANARFAIPRHGSAYRWWQCQCAAMWAVVALYYVAVSGAACLPALARAGSENFFASPLPALDALSLVLLMTAANIAVMGACITLQLAVHLLSGSAMLGASLFLLVIVLPVFAPSYEAARFLPGNWLMVRRSALATGGGYGMAVVWPGAACVTAVGILMARVAASQRKMMW